MSGILLALLLLSLSSTAVAETDDVKKPKPEKVTGPETGPMPDAPVPSDRNETGLNVFQAGQEKKVEAKLVQQNEKAGYLLLRNVTTEVLNVRFPDAFVGVNVIGDGSNSQVGGRGTAQSTGIAVTPGQGSRNGNAGLFSIPPGETLRLPVTSVCLEYGKPEPNANLRYVIMPVEQYSKSPVFHELLPLFTKTKVSQRVAQAAAWHLSNGLSWTELAGVTNPQAGGLPLPLFTANDLRAAKALVDKATELAIEKQKSKKPATKPSVKAPSRSPRKGR